MPETEARPPAQNRYGGAIFRSPTNSGDHLRTASTSENITIFLLGAACDRMLMLSIAPGYFRVKGAPPLPKQLPSKLDSASSRLRLEARPKPYFALVSPNVSLGYRRKKTGAGSWSARGTANGSDWTKKIGFADDYEAPDGKHVLDYWGAIQLARQIARRQPGDTEDDGRPIIVAEAVDQYEKDLKSRGRSPANAARVHKHLTSALAAKPVMLLAVRDLRSWRDGLVAKGVKPPTINRVRAGLRAALELAATLDHRITNRDAFRQGLKGLPGGKNARRIVLPDAEVLRIVKAAYQENDAFGLLVQVLAETGARVSQVARLPCVDLQADRPDPRLMVSPSYKGRGEKQVERIPVPITDAQVEAEAAEDGNG